MPGCCASVLPEGRPGDLVSAGLLDREDEERFRFRHPLLQEAAYQEVPAERRRALHEQIAAVMAESGNQSRLSALPSTSSGRAVRRLRSRCSRPLRS